MPWALFFFAPLPNSQFFFLLSLLFFLQLRFLLYFSCVYGLSSVSQGFGPCQRPINYLFWYQISRGISEHFLHFLVCGRLKSYKLTRFSATSQFQVIIIPFMFITYDENSSYYLVCPSPSVFETLRHFLSLFDTNACPTQRYFIDSVT